jgi:hypothetical protein
MTPRERLQLLCDRFEKDTKHKVVMHCWSTASGRQIRDKNFCGTSCCLLGFACSIPELQAEGLCLDNWPAIPTFNGAIGYRAAELFFSLAPATVQRLFNSHSYRISELYDRQAVLDRLKTIISEDKT